MNQVEKNKEAWGLLSEDHYKHFKKRFEEDNYFFNPFVLKEIGNLSGKKVLHLQCNTGADSIVLAKMGAHVTGVDLVPDNIHFATQLAKDLEVENVNFIVSDIMELMDNHEGKYDIVFTSDGAIGWLPDLKKWGRTIRHFLKDDGFFYAHDGHPFYLSFDEEKINDGVIDIKYPYFKKDPDEDTRIGGYASESKEAKNYFWMYTIGDIINGLAQAGLCIEWFNEYDRCVPGVGGKVADEEGLMYHPELEGAVPIMFSLKATPR
ncbi:Methyltransferase domain-containing protein [Pelagirhabdus alkalitolerans]|uniref:Methyltransferase domain-containing protein n=1 Tax=Pelagirhabdus alkalitolerans TaxID=1612202 RepID=A0A1G6IQ21_9BACI|nr:class I SAM-dependent methyltransferase [Pelagirhabdus alkalitolerans]SDC08533.1 Methyltransferase domain-containing protein [Pelagirhabdus alkalitolerans]